jgi:Flp pilus assembly protein protease CpaA
MGDVKMMAAAGAIARWQGLVVIFVYTGLLGGLAGLILAAARGRLWATLKSTGRLLGLLGRGKLDQARHIEPAAGRLAYGAVIAGGCFIYLWIGPKSL